MLPKTKQGPFGLLHPVSPMIKTPSHELLFKIPSYDSDSKLATGMRPYLRNMQKYSSR